MISTFFCVYATHAEVSGPAQAERRRILSGAVDSAVHNIIYVCRSRADDQDRWIVRESKCMK